MEKIKIESTDQVLSILRGMTDDESIIAKIALGLKDIHKSANISYQEEYVAPETVEEPASLQIKEVKRQSNRRKKLKVTKEPKIITLTDATPKEKKSKKSKKSEVKEIHLF